MYQYKTKSLEMVIANCVTAGNGVSKSINIFSNAGAIFHIMNVIKKLAAITRHIR